MTHRISTTRAAKTGTKRSKRLVTYSIRYAGFPIPHSDALAWANRIRKADGKSLLTDKAKHAGQILLTIEDSVVAAGGACCLPHGRFLPAQPYELYFICTHYEEGKWRRVNGILEPGDYFVEGSEEAIAKELLDREGKSQITLSVNLSKI